MPDLTDFQLEVTRLFFSLPASNGDLGLAFQPWTGPARDAILRPPKPEIAPSPHILQRVIGRDADWEAADLLVLYGLRRDEVLGLRWQDIDLDAGTIHVEQQVQRVGGEMHIGPVKTRAGHRKLPLLKLARRALEAQSATQPRYRAAMGSAWPDTDLVFTTPTGRPIEPRNLVRSFRRICEANHLRLTKVHHLRHTVASLLKALGVPARDAQIILGHSRLAVTLEVYTHTDDEAQLDALTRLHNLFDQA
jgi:integrase